MSQSESFRNLSFSRMVGSSVLEYVEKHIPLRGRILDFGCAYGFLIEELVRRGISCEGIDSNPEAIKFCSKRFENNSLVERFVVLRQNEPFPFEEASVDILFFIETIEHLLDDEIEFAFAEFARIIPPNGYLIVTTPNEENLKAHQIICPDCGCVFHQMQHVRSFNRQSLVSIITKCGFETLVCEATEFHPPILLRKRIMATLMSVFALRRKKMMSGSPPHLVFIGRRI